MSRRSMLIIPLLGLWVSGALALQPPTPEETLEVNRRISESKSNLLRWATRQARGVRDYDAQHYTLRFDLDFQERSFQGQVGILAEPTEEGLQTLALDMHDSLELISVTDGLQPLQHVHGDHLLQVTLNRPYMLGETFLVVVTYAGSDGWTFDFEDWQGSSSLSTFAEPEYARTWWPCNDVPTDKATCDLHVTGPDWAVILGNGNQTADVDHGDGTHTVTWETDYPITTYLVALAASDYVRIDYEYQPLTGGDPLPVPLWVYPYQEDWARENHPDVVDMIEFFSASFGEYPFLGEKYGQVAIPGSGGGMEHQTITHLGAGGVGSIGLVGHELAHMWWGDYITMETWEDIWLNEGFATYSDALYQEHAFGSDHLRDLMAAYAGREYSGSVYDPDYTFNSTVYQKGAWVLHMLRDLAGEDGFWTILQTYYADPRFAYANASTPDFQAICEGVYGESLEAFFQQWVYGEGRPDLRYLWDSQETRDGYRLDLDLHQVQTVGLFRVPLDVRILTESGAIDHRVWIEQVLESFSFDLDEPPLDVQFDPRVKLLKWLEPHPDQFQITDPPRLPPADFGLPYSHALDVQGGDPPYRFELLDGDLPPGIELDLASGVFTGAPQEKGRFEFTLRVSDDRQPPRRFTRTYQLRGLNSPLDAEIATDAPTYSGSDVMTVSLHLRSKLEEEALEARLYLVLGVGGEFWFLDPLGEPYPSFTPEAVGLDLVLEPLFEMDAAILEIPFPPELPSLEAAWYAAGINPATGLLWAPISESVFTLQDAP